MLYAEDAAYAMSKIATMDDLPLIATLLESDPERGRAALQAVAKPFDKRVIDYLLNIVRTNPDAEARKTAAVAFSRIAGKDQTRQVLELLPGMDPQTQEQLLISVRRAWSYPPSEMDGDRFTSEATGSELRVMQKALKDAIRTFIDAHRDPESGVNILFLKEELDALNATDAVSPGT